MNLVQITPEAPSARSGGGIGVRQTLLSLIKNGDAVDYIGPAISDPTLAALYRRTFFLAPSHNIPLRIYDTLFMNTNQRYRAWKKLDFQPENYDAAVLDFTKLNYVLPNLSELPLLVRVHNVEQDYSRNQYHHHKTPITFLDARFSGPRERQIVRRADRLLVLTEKDRARLCSLYQIAPQKTQLLPVCLPAPEDVSSCAAAIAKTGTVSDISASKAPLRLLITGSLWYGSNYEGILWFLKEVYPKLSCPVQLCIAGARPNPELRESVQSDARIKLIDTPPDMAPYFRDADLFLAPVFDGAGMKVKVAEAFSYGLPVVGTHHAFEGYDIIPGRHGWFADDKEAFRTAIEAFFSCPKLEQMAMKTAVHTLFMRRYSISCSAEIFREALQEICTR